MALPTSDLWKQIQSMRHTVTEFKFEINGKEYDEHDEISHSVDSGLFEEFAIGQATCAELELEIIADEIPRGATIKRYVRLVNGNLVSEWIPAGVYFVNTRSYEDGVWKIEAFDIMRKAEQQWTPVQSLDFPMPMDTACNLFATILGTSIDERSQISHTYTIDYPGTTDPDDPEDEPQFYTIRQHLQWIAAAHAANWIVTAEGKLLLVPLGGEPEETNFLITEYGKPINFGGSVILV